MKYMYSFRQALFHIIGLTRIRAFEDRYPFRLQTEIKAEEIKLSVDIKSKEKESCLYVSDSKERCVWRITRETDDTQKIIKWLTTDYNPGTDHEDEEEDEVDEEEEATEEEEKEDVGVEEGNMGT